MINSTPIVSNVSTDGTTITTDTSGALKVTDSFFTDILFGDGSDGDVTISVNTNITSDKCYHNLIVATGVTVTVNSNVIIRGNGQFTPATNAIVAWQGQAGGAGGAQGGTGGTGVGGAGGTSGGHGQFFFKLGSLGATGIKITANGATGSNAVASSTPASSNGAGTAGSDGTNGTFKGTSQANSKGNFGSQGGTGASPVGTG